MTNNYNLGGILGNYKKLLLQTKLQNKNMNYQGKIIRIYENGSGVIKLDDFVKVYYFHKDDCDDDVYIGDIVYFKVFKSNHYRICYNISNYNKHKNSIMFNLIKTDEPVNSNTDEPVNSNTDEPVNSNTDEPVNSNTDEPVNSIEMIEKSAISNDMFTVEMSMVGNPHDDYFEKENPTELNNEFLRKISRAINTDRLIGRILKYFTTHDIISSQHYNEISTDKFKTKYELALSSLVFTGKNNAWMKKWQILYGNIIIKKDSEVKISKTWKKYLLYL